ncbi:EF-hand domain-containing protein [Turneriella parva]|nr:EF-hand domain-containing protein [Turneriella parva]
MTQAHFAALLFVAMTFTVSAKNHKGGHAGMKGPMHAKMLEKMDADKDGKISKQEWQAHHDKKFIELDADKDGVISQDEFKAHHEKMMKDHHSKMGKNNGAVGDANRKYKKPPRKKKNKDDDLQFDGPAADEKE